MNVSVIAVEQILPLRRAVLRTSMPMEAARFDGDHEPTTLHLAALEGQAVLGCATLMFRPCPVDQAPAWQLRGMAVHPAYRGTGVGSMLLLACHEQAAQRPGTRRMWCNARLGAVSFYRRHGWQIISEAFAIPGVGPHHRMCFEPPACG